MYGESQAGPAKVIKYTVPVILSLAVSGAGAALGGLAGVIGGAAAAAVAWPIATDFLKEVAKDIVKDRLDALGSAGLDQYRRLHHGLLQVPDVASHLQKVVLREFGCEISLSKSR